MSESIYKNSFEFDRECFRDYAMLYMYPHYRYVGRRCAKLGGFIIFFSLVLFIPLCLNLSSIKSFTWLFPVFALLCFGSWLLVYGIVKLNMIDAKRSFYWGASWGDVALKELAGTRKDIIFPFDAMSFPTGLYLFFWYSRILADQTRFEHYVIPNKHPSYETFRENPKPVALEAHFTQESVYKGTSKQVFAASYADICDIYEHKKIPGWAIIRNKKAKELLIKTDSFEGGASWDEVKKFAFKRKKEDRWLFMRKLREKLKTLFKA